jgi:3-hydroxymyristoyl/3-hydroxydecanoyl-(acyl carrier protein) dehydratase
VNADTGADTAALLRAAARTPMLFDRASTRVAASVDRAGIEALIPHRGAALLIDRIEHCDIEHATIACVWEAGRQASLWEGHFPGHPVVPGTLQIEAIGQAGLCLLALEERRASDPSGATFALTHVLGAEFVHPVTPDRPIEIVARVLSDGLFTVVIGQCIQNGSVRSAAAVRGISQERTK